MLVSVIMLAGPSLFFFKGKNELIVKYVPLLPQSQYTVVAARSNSPWEEAAMRRSANWFYHSVPFDSTIRAVACYFQSGATVDDNFGMLYLYEVKLRPRMILPISLKQLDLMLKTADGKLASKATKHDYGEAMMAIGYVTEILNAIPDPMRECLFRTEKRRLLDYAAELQSRP
jgi:hypothetical protein